MGIGGLGHRSSSPRAHCHSMVTRVPRYLVLCVVAPFVFVGQIVFLRNLLPRYESVTPLVGSLEAQTAQRLSNEELTTSKKNRRDPPPHHLNPPHQNNTVVAIVNMHRSNKKVQRLVCSLRRRGEWQQGPVLIITDTDELVVEYQHAFSKHCGPVYVASARPEDLVPTNASGRVIKYRKKTMVYKRFKNLVWDYLERDTPLSLSQHIEYILYVDSDNVVAGPLQEFLTVSYNSILYSTGLGPAGSAYSVTPPPNIRLTNLPPPKLNMSVMESFFTTFPQPLGSGRLQYHGGLMLNHRHYSRFCLDSWKAAFDDTENEDFNQPLDQLILVKIPEFTHYKCQIQLISDAVMTFPTPEDARDHTLNTFVHFTRYREQELRNDLNATQLYMLDLLNATASEPMLLEMFGPGEYSLLV